jgi:hypothetical protein
MNGQRAFSRDRSCAVGELQLEDRRLLVWLGEELFQQAELRHHLQGRGV